MHAYRVKANETTAEQLTTLLLCMLPDNSVRFSLPFADHCKCESETKPRETSGAYVQVCCFLLLLLFSQYHATDEVDIVT